MLDGNFVDALTEHLAALQARDIERFGHTIGDDVAVVDGSGTMMRGWAPVIASHAEWFASADPWTFEYTVLLAREMPGAAFALIDVTYRQTPAARAARFVLSLFFERDAVGRWRFVFDQNTALADAAD